MRQLYKEEGVDLRKWISATNDAHHDVLEKLDEALSVIRSITTELGLQDLFAPSVKVTVDFDEVTDEELDALAEQIMKEDRLRGINTFK